MENFFNVLHNRNLCVKFIVLEDLRISMVYQIELMKYNISHYFLKTKIKTIVVSVT